MTDFTLSNHIISFGKSLFFWIKNRTYIQVLLTFSLFFILFSFIYFSVPNLTSYDDHFFHFRFAEQMKSDGFFESFENFKSIYFSEMSHGNKYFVYYNFLFYLLILPFTFITPLFAGIKLYAIFSVSLTFAIFYYLLKKLQIRYSSFFIIFAIATIGTDSLWRFFLSRPYTLTPILLLAILTCLYHKKYTLVFIISLLYTFWHSATFFMPIFVSVLYFVIERIARGRNDYLIIWPSLAGTSVAIILVYVLSPGFFIYIKNIIFGVVSEAARENADALQKGQEAYKIGFFEFFRRNFLLLSTFIMSGIIELYNFFAKIKSKKFLIDQQNKVTTFRVSVLVLSVLFLIGTIYSSLRFGDYFYIFAGFYIVMIVSSILPITHIRDYTLKSGIFVGVAVTVLVLFISNMYFLQKSFANGADPGLFEATGRWLSDNTQSGDIVFMTSWVWFPSLYYYSPENYYVVGLEPRFLYDHDPSLYWLWHHISTDGYVCEFYRCSNIEQDRNLALRNESTSLNWYKKEGYLIDLILREKFQASYIIINPILDRNLALVLENNHNLFKRTFVDNEYNYYIYSVNTTTI